MLRKGFEESDSFPRRAVGAQRSPRFPTKIYSQLSLNITDSLLSYPLEFSINLLKRNSEFVLSRKIISLQLVWQFSAKILTGWIFNQFNKSCLGSCFCWRMRFRGVHNRIRISGDGPLSNPWLIVSLWDGDFLNSPKIYVCEKQQFVEQAVPLPSNCWKIIRIEISEINTEVKNVMSSKHFK